MTTWNILDDNHLSLLKQTSPSSTFTQTTLAAQTAVSPSNISRVVQQESSRLSGDLNLLI